MSIIGIIEASSSNVAGENCFPLGVPPTYYQYCDKHQIFTKFYNDFETANGKWQTGEELDFNMFCRHVKKYDVRSWQRVISIWPEGREILLRLRSGEIHHSRG